MLQNNLILINGGAYTEVKKALKKWIDLYSDQLENDLDFQLYKNGNGNHVIKVDDKLNNESFFYLVNYLNYPEGIDYKVDIIYAALLFFCSIILPVIIGNFFK